MTDQGDLLRSVRIDRGQSQAGLARRLGVSREYVSMLESGRRGGSADLWLRADEILSAGGRLAAASATAPTLSPDRLQLSDPELAGLLAEGLDLPIGADTAERIAHEWLVTGPPAPLRLDAGRRVGGEGVATLERRVVQLRRIDDYVAGGDLAPIVEREVAAATGLITDGTYTDPIGHRLLAALGELCQLAGWTASDAGHHRTAARYYLAGVKAAHWASDVAGAANLISSLSYQTANVGDPRDALLLARTAAVGAAGRSPALVQALLSERVAWAAARAGDAPAAEAALQAADEAYAHENGAGPDWTYWLDEDELAVMAARCWVELNRPAIAIDVLTAVLDRYDISRTRERALYWSWLAEALATAEDLDHAVAAAQETVDLAGATSSKRADARVDHVIGVLAPRRAVPVVADFLDSISESG